MVGFKELFRRLQIQEQMTKQHQTRVDVSENAAAAAVVFGLRTLKPSDYQQRTFEADFVVSRTEYTDVQFMLAANRLFMTEITITNTAASESGGI